MARKNAIMRRTATCPKKTCKWRCTLKGDKHAVEQVIKGHVHDRHCA